MNITEQKIFKESSKSKKSFNALIVALLGLAFVIVGEIPVAILYYVLPPIMPEYLEVALLDFILGFGLVILIAFAYIKKIEKRNIKTLGLYKEGAVKSYFGGFALGIGFMLAIVVVGVIIGTYKVSVNEIKIYTVFTMVIMLLGFVIQGACEEVVSRGFVLQALTRRYNLVAGIIGSSVFFTALHSFNPGMSIIPVVNLFLVGLFFALYYIKTKNLWGVFGIHTAWNWSQGNLFGIKVSGTVIPGGSIFETTPANDIDILNGGAFGAEGSIICSLILLIATLYLFFNLKKNYKFK